MGVKLSLASCVELWGFRKLHRGHCFCVFRGLVESSVVLLFVEDPTEAVQLP